MVSPFPNKAASVDIGKDSMKTVLRFFFCFSRVENNFVDTDITKIKTHNEREDL